MFDALATMRRRVRALAPLVFRHAAQRSVGPLRVRVRAALDHRKTRLARREWPDTRGGGATFFRFHVSVDNVARERVDWARGELLLAVRDADARVTLSRFALRAAEYGSDDGALDFSTRFDEVFQVPLRSRYGQVDAALVLRRDVSAGAASDVRRVPASAADDELPADADDATRDRFNERLLLARFGTELLPGDTVCTVSACLAQLPFQRVPLTADESRAVRSDDARREWLRDAQRAVTTGEATEDTEFAVAEWARVVPHELSEPRDVPASDTEQLQRE